MIRKWFNQGCDYCMDRVDRSGGFRTVTPPADMNGEDDNHLVVSRFHIDIPSKTLCYFGEDATGEGMDDYITIKYCPMCGKKL